MNKDDEDNLNQPVFEDEEGLAVGFKKKKGKKKKIKTNRYRQAAIE